MAGVYAGPSYTPPAMTDVPTGEAPADPTAVDLRHYVEFDPDRPAGRRAFETDVLAVDVVCLEPQQTVEARTFPTADAVYTVIGGRAWVVTDETEVVLEALQAVLIPAGVPHGLRNSSPDPLILQVVTSPPDEAPVLPPGPSDQARRERAAAARREGLLDRVRRGLGSR